jgi:tetratricopeptide (TPR) repeat protein
VCPASGGRTASRFSANSTTKRWPSSASGKRIEEKWFEKKAIKLAVGGTCGRRSGRGSDTARRIYSRAQIRIRFRRVICFSGARVIPPTLPASAPAPASRSRPRWLRAAAAVVAFLCLGAGGLAWWKADAGRSARRQVRPAERAPTICITTEPFEVPRLGLMDRVLPGDHEDFWLSRDPVAMAVRTQVWARLPDEMPAAVWPEIEQIADALSVPDWTNARTLPLALNDPNLHMQIARQQRATLVRHESLFGPVHPESLASRRRLVIILQAQGQPAEAEAETRAMLAIREQFLGPAHADTLSLRNEFANFLLRQRRASEAEREYRTVLTLRERVLGPRHPLTLSSRNNLANALDAQGRHADAEAGHRAVLALREQAFGRTHPAVLQSCFNLAMALANQGKVREAVEFAWRAEEGRKRQPSARFAQAGEASECVSSAVKKLIASKRATRVVP